MTITAAPLDLFNTQEQCIDAATNAIKDYRSTMEKVVESWLKNELGTIEQLADAIGRSPKTLKTDYVSQLRKQGRLPQARTGSATHKSSRSSRKKKVAGNPATPVENSEPEIELVTVTVEDPPTPAPAPTPTPSAPQPAPASTPEPAPSVPSAGSSEPFQWADHPRLKGWNGSLNERGQKIYNREVRSSRSRVRMAEQLAEFKVEIEKSMKAASNNHSNGGGWALLEADVAMVEATLQREKRPGIKETLEAVMHEAERIQKYASETLRVLQLTETLKP